MEVMIELLYIGIKTLGSSNMQLITDQVKMGLLFTVEKPPLDE